MFLLNETNTSSEPPVNNTDKNSPGLDYGKEEKTREKTGIIMRVVTESVTKEILENLRSRREI